LSESGHQTPILTSRRDLSAIEVAFRMFERWGQESFFKTLKIELGDPSRQAAHRELFEYIEGFSNTWRLHSSLGYLSPTEFERLYARLEAA